MYPLFESLALVNGFVQNPSWHQKRFLKSYNAYYGAKPSYDLLDHVFLQREHRKGVFKLRISYNEVGTKVEIQNYQLKPIRSLKMLDGDKLDYHLKYQDRNSLNELFKLRDTSDDILIVRNGLITDSSYSNIVFYDGTAWYTPDSPLLEGTARARLIKEGKIVETKIGVEDLKKYTSFKLINALRDFDKIGQGKVSDIS